MLVYHVIAPPLRMLFLWVASWCLSTCAPVVSAWPISWQQLTSTLFRSVLLSEPAMRASQLGSCQVWVTVAWVWVKECDLQRGFPQVVHLAVPVLPCLPAHVASQSFYVLDLSSWQDRFLSAVEEICAFLPTLIHSSTSLTH